jgi:hypothetical protein
LEFGVEDSTRMEVERSTVADRAMKRASPAAFR